MTNKVANLILAYLQTKHGRVYRNKAVSNPVFPYVVFHIDTVTDSYPTNDYYVHVQIYDVPNVPVKVIDNIADAIDAVNHTVINDLEVNLHITRINRQYVPNMELTDSQMIDIQYAVRAYGKE